MPQKLTDDELLDLIRSDTPLAKARARFSHWFATIEQMEGQAKLPSILDIRRVEIEAVEDIWRLKP
jgi:hypothetical protein